MLWQMPRYEEIKMDAEIGSYQADDGTPPYYVRPLPAVAEAGGSPEDTEACST
jgi:hypothetical protein